MHKKIKKVIQDESKDVPIFGLNMKIPTFIAIIRSPGLAYVYTNILNKTRAPKTPLEPIIDTKSDVWSIFMKRSKRESKAGETS